MKILYIHGFSSSSKAKKAGILRKHFGSKDVIAPSLPINPYDTIEILSKIIKTEKDNFLLIGSSLGGFYAEYFLRNHNKPCVLLNPSISPHISLKKRIGLGKHFRSGNNEMFELTQNHINIFKELFSKMSQKPANPEYLNIIVCKNDDLLNPDLTLKHFGFTNKTIILDSGGHTMTNFESQLNLIEQLLIHYK